MKTLLMLMLGLITCGAYPYIYLKVGTKVVLSPGRVTDNITSIVWKHGPNVTVERFGGISKLYKDHCTLNTTTGELIISNLTLEDSGSYTAEINDKVLHKTEIVVITAVPTPTISKSCDDEQTYCILTCEVNDTTDAEPVSYFWKLHDMVLGNQNKEFKITKKTVEQRISCGVENPVSYKYSKAVFNPFIKNPLYWFLLPGLILVVGVCVNIGIFLYKRKGQKAVTSSEEKPSWQEKRTKDDMI